MGTKKVKISATKRALHNSRKNKVSKITKPAKKQSTKVQKLSATNTGKSPKKVKQNGLPKIPIPNVDDYDSDIDADNMMGMMEDDDLKDMKSSSNVKDAVKKFTFLKKINMDDHNSTPKEPTLRGRKRKKQELLEQQEENDASVYESMYNDYNLENKKRETIPLLPIKTKDGNVLTREAKVLPEEDSVDEEEDVEIQEEVEVDYDSDADVVNPKTPQNDTEKKNSISTADLLIRREQEIQRQKYRIGIICSGILEKPEGKMKNFTPLFEMMNKKNDDGSMNLISTRKIAMISVLELFKDIIPDYRLGFVDLEKTKVKKITLERVTFENEMLQQFKKYLQCLEKMTGALAKKRRGGGKPSADTIKIAELSVHCLCELLLSNPYFNFGQNIAQMLVYLANNNNAKVRETINKCFKEIFKSDKRFEITLFIVRRLNHIIKNNNNDIHIEVITTLMSLPIKNVNLDAEKEKELKQKKLESHRQRIMNLSKREKKRKQKLIELDRELQETNAEETKQTKHYKLTEITKMIFTIYFRILKNDPNSKLLSSVLEGLAKFAHLINMDFFTDLVNVLNSLMETGELGYREQLFCIKTVFTILSGQGEMLNIDPSRFYTHLYKNILEVNAGKNHNDLTIILRTLEEVLIKRRKHITQPRLLAFVKRIASLALQLNHNGSIGVLGMLKMAFQFNSSLEILLDTDSSFGSGQYNPNLNEPEYCNANCTALYELAALQRHYHPIVKKYAKHIINGVPSSGDGCLPSELGKLSPEELFHEFDSTNMSFNPPIPTPLNVEAKKKPGRHFYMDKLFENFCKNPSNHSTVKEENLNFCVDYWNNLQIVKE